MRLVAEVCKWPKRAPRVSHPIQSPNSAYPQAANRKRAPRIATVKLFPAPRVLSISRTRAWTSEAFPVIPSPKGRLSKHQGLPLGERTPQTITADPPILMPYDSKPPRSNTSPNATHTVTDTAPPSPHTRSQAQPRSSPPTETHSNTRTSSASHGYPSARESGAKAAPQGSR